MGEKGGRDGQVQQPTRFQSPFHLTQSFANLAAQCSVAGKRRHKGEEGVRGAAGQECYDVAAFTRPVQKRAEYEFQYNMHPDD